MRTSIFRLALPCYDDQGGGAGAPAPAGAAPGGQPSASAPGASSATGTSPAAAGTPPAGSPPAKPSFTYAEDRSNWVPSHRLRQTSDEIAKIKQDLAFERQRVAALSGIAPPKPQASPEHNAIREQLFAVAPELKDVFDHLELLKELKGLNLKETVTNLQGFATQSWQQRGTTTLNALTEKVKAAFGGADLGAKQMGRITRAFIGELEDDPETRARYEAGDASVIDDFVKDFTQGVLDPYRRSTAAQANAGAGGNGAARRLPRGGGGSPVAMPGRTVKPADGETYHKAAFDAFQRG